jgi:hypothetical protein
MRVIRPCFVGGGVDEQEGAQQPVVAADDPPHRRSLHPLLLRAPVPHGPHNSHLQLNLSCHHSRHSIYPTPLLKLNRQGDKLKAVPLSLAISSSTGSKPSRPRVRVAHEYVPQLNFTPFVTEPLERLRGVKLHYPERVQGYTQSCDGSS